MSTRPLIVLYDGWCSVCTKGAKRLRPYERKHPDRLALRDLREHDDLIKRHGIDPKAARRTMHAITPQGEVLTAMNAVRATARAAGKGWMIAWTALPGIRWIADKLYNRFARNRLRWFRSSGCPDGACSIDD